MSKPLQPTVKGASLEINKTGYQLLMLLDKKLIGKSYPFRYLAVYHTKQSESCSVICRRAILF